MPFDPDRSLDLSIPPSLLDIAPTASADIKLQPHNLIDRGNDTPHSTILQFRPASVGYLLIVWTFLPFLVLTRIPSPGVQHFQVRILPISQWLLLCKYFLMLFDPTPDPG